MRTAMIVLGTLVAACGQNAVPPEENAPASEAPAENDFVAAPVLNVADPGLPKNAAEPVNAGACRTQDGRAIAANQLRATGTEPFWSAKIDGRCITYSTPENQAGTRVWAKFTGTRHSGQWSGFLGKDRFVLTTRRDAKCSDGMSDRTYPIAVTLTIGDQERRGCATPE